MPVVTLYQKTKNGNKASVLSIKLTKQITLQGMEMVVVKLVCRAHITDDKHVKVIHLHYGVSMSGG